MCSEASYLSSGFAIYAKELLTRLHQTQKYEIAEFASYGVVNDPRDTAILWKYYANAVEENDPRHSEYMSRPDNQFGRWRFEKVLLDFKPDVVIDVRDYWMSYYQALSPLRKYFHWILMPTVDSYPQQQSWLDTYLSADAIFTYSDWGAEVLKEQTSGKINYVTTAAPGVDLSTFKPIDENNRRSLRADMGLPPEAIIIGSVMRNQKRKLIPDLLFAFRNTLDQLYLTNPTKADKLYLYLHTSYPDSGWDIPELLKSTSLSNRVYFSYVCNKCNTIYSKTFCGPMSGCKNCDSISCRVPSVTNGVTSKQLAQIYNLFDIYVQYSICEGAGMPQIEAGASGLPIVTVDYSAMVDIINKLKAQKIRIQTKFKELETKAFRVYPNNQDLTKHLLRLILLPQDELAQIKTETRLLTEQHYNWDGVAKKWENYLDSISTRSDWSVPPKYYSKFRPHENNMPNIDMLTDICNNHLGDYSLLSSMFFLDMLKDLDYGFVQDGIKVSAYKKQDMESTIDTLIHNNNSSEKVRYSNTSFNDDYIEYAKIKKSLS
jgi:glycosyltransferase involved in cell wall biosynthesis